MCVFVGVCLCVRACVCVFVYVCVGTYMCACVCMLVSNLYSNLRQGWFDRNVTNLLSCTLLVCFAIVFAVSKSCVAHTVYDCDVAVYIQTLQA